MNAKVLVDASYFIAAALFILGLKGMSSPVTARKGIMWAGVGMALATLATFMVPGIQNLFLIGVALAIGGGLAWVSGKRVEMTAMPQMVAIYNGMGGGAAAAIAAVEFTRGHITGAVVTSLAIIGALIGAVSFAGSCVAYAKLQGIITKPIRLPQQNAVNVVLTVATLGIGLLIIASPTLDPQTLIAFFVISLVLGTIITLPIGGADMPVVISLFNALTGLAVGFEGFVMGIPALIIAGIVVGAAGTLLTQLMAKAMNRPLTNILFQPLAGGAGEASGTIEGRMKEVSALDAASMMRFGGKVIVVPGYGMAVAGAQHKVWEMTELLEEDGIEVKFAIHPVAGRMPGHMNVLLAEAGVPYDKIADMEEINGEFGQADVALIIGANDVVNPSARQDKSSPIYGMPILNADAARNVLVIKRGQGTGYSGIENALFYRDNCHMLYGSAQKVVGDVIQHIKAMAKQA